jgi:hypothetical protein
MKKPVGVLGTLLSVPGEDARTGQWPERTIEAPDKPLGLSLSSVPDPEPFEGTLFDALVILSAATSKRPKPGPISKADENFFLGLEYLQKTGGNEGQARELFIVKQTGKASIDLSPEDRSVVSKRFTRDVLKPVRELKLKFFNASDKCN